MTLRTGNVDDLTALLAAIITAPDEDTPRLMYADALDERGEPGDRERAEFVRVQVELSRTPEPIGPLAGMRTKRHHFGGTCTKCTDTTHCSYHVLDHRAKGLFTGMSGKGIVSNEQHWQRGFVNTLTFPADLFLRHADALIWHPTQLQVCRRCDGDGKVHGSDRPFGYSGPGSYPGPCPVCKGSGRGTEPRPCPPTAQPVRRVVLTTVPLSSGRSDNVPLPVSWFQQKWPGVEFVLPLYTATMAVAAALHGMEVPVSATELYEATGLTPPTE